MKPEDRAADLPVSKGLLMDEETDTRLSQLQQRIDRGDYRIEPGAIADVILRRLRERAAKRAWGEAQTECSYPARGRSESVKATPGGPATTWPIQVHWAPEPTVGAA
jgi:predicted transcriptional regulator